MRFDHYGGIDVLEVRDVPRPSPDARDVLVEVKAAGINPGEAMIREGSVDARDLCGDVSLRAGQRPGRCGGRGRP